MNAQPEFPVFDPNGIELRVRGRVHMGNEPPFGTITFVSDPDGDADAEGRIYPVNPAVTVKWDGEEGDGEIFTSHYDHTTDTYVCEDIEDFKVTGAVMVRHKERGTEHSFSDYNYHGVGEFIAQFKDGDASSEFCHDWEPFDLGTGHTISWRDVKGQLTIDGGPRRTSR